MRRIRSVVSAFLIGILVTYSPLGLVQGAGKDFMTIGTGDAAGVYYATGGAICRLVNKDRERHGLRCLIESTGGSVSNIESLRAGKSDMGLMQSDWQYHASNGTSKFASLGPFEDLRAVFSIYPEPFTVVARADAGIKNFDDLKGKRVNIGNPGSGQRGTMEILMKAKGWTTEDFSETLQLKPGAQSQALCDDEVDAIVFTVGHPNSSIFEATTACDSVIVEVMDADVKRLVARNPYYILTTIPGGMYRNNPHDVATFGVKATLGASARTPDNYVYVVVQSVFDNFDEFRRLHPALAGLTKEAMIKSGNSAPLHPGAARYFQEAGLLD
jgi:hypothetical protein